MTESVDKQIKDYAYTYGFRHLNDILALHPKQKKVFLREFEKKGIGEYTAYLISMGYRKRVSIKKKVHVRSHTRTVRRGQSKIKHGKYIKAGKKYKHNLWRDAKTKAKHIGPQYAGWRGDSHYSGKYKGWV